MNSRSKGCRGERSLRDAFREEGFTARRGQQFSGERGNPDVIVDALPSIHLEAKFCKATALYDWMAQAEGDANRSGQDKIPIVCHRKNNEEWLAVLKLSDFIQLLRETDRIQS